jgi:hypothetical protein
MKHCPHGQNTLACVQCWRRNPTAPPPTKPEQPARQEIAHPPCGCRLAVRGFDVIRWDPCEQHEPKEPTREPGRHTAPVQLTSPRWFWMQCLEGKLAGFEGQTTFDRHSLEERKTCNDPTCERAWASKERGRRQA